MRKEDKYKSNVGRIGKQAVMGLSEGIVLSSYLPRTGRIQRKSPLGQPVPQQKFQIAVSSIRITCTATELTCSVKEKSFKWTTLMAI